MYIMSCDALYCACHRETSCFSKLQYLLHVRVSAIAVLPLIPCIFGLCQIMLPPSCLIIGVVLSKIKYILVNSLKLVKRFDQITRYFQWNCLILKGYFNDPVNFNISCFATYRILIKHADIIVIRIYFVLFVLVSFVANPGSKVIKCVVRKHQRN